MATITPVHADITTSHVDAIVSPAAASLHPGGGVDIAIHRAAGPALLQESLRRYPHGIATGDAGWTTAGALVAHWVIHAVDPNHRAEPDRTVLESCYRHALQQADELGVRTVAFPLIGVGRHGWPLDEAVAAAVDALATAETDVKEVQVVTPDLAAFIALEHGLALAVPLHILQGIQVLHRRGYHRLRLLAYLSPTGKFWRLEITSVDNLRAGEYFEVLDHRRAIYYTTGSEQRFAEAKVTAATGPDAIAALILAALPGLVRRADDPGYVAWLADLVGLARRHWALPIAFDDSPREFPGWEIGWGSGIFHPEPPPPPASAGS